MISNVTFHLNNIQTLFETIQKLQYVGLFAHKTSGTFDVVIADNWMRASRNDDHFRIATVLVFFVDEWSIFAPDSGLFDSRYSLLKEEIWKLRLQLSIIFLRVYTLYENQSQEVIRSMDHILRSTCGWEQERHRAFQQIIVDDNKYDIQRLFQMIQFSGDRKLIW